jgi:hypothetical protein
MLMVDAIVQLEAHRDADARPFKRAVGDAGESFCSSRAFILGGVD